MFEGSCFKKDLLSPKYAVLRELYACSLMMQTNIPEINIFKFKGVPLLFVFNIQK
jgi:hypothetical protein